MKELRMIGETVCEFNFKTGGYRATITCPNCKKLYLCDTTDSDIIRNPKNCFICYMKSYKKLIDGPNLGTDDAGD